jgi:hypothetical protein
MENKHITYKISKKAKDDGARDVQFFADGEEVRTGAYQSTDGLICMVRCPSCEAENYAIVVATGACAWCAFDPLRDAEEEK